MNRKRLAPFACLFAYVLGPPLGAQNRTPYTTAVNLRRSILLCEFESPTVTTEASLSRTRRTGTPPWSSARRLTPSKCTWSPGPVRQSPSPGVRLLELAPQPKRCRTACMALVMQPWSISAMYSINNGQPPTDIGTPTITLDPSAAVTFPTATALSSLSPFLLPFLVPPVLVAIEGVNAQQ